MNSFSARLAGLATTALAALGLNASAATPSEPGIAGTAPAGWSAAAFDRVAKKAESLSFKLAFTKKKMMLDEGAMIEPNLFTKKAVIMDPIVSPGDTLFTKKALTPETQMFTKKKAIDGTTPLIQPNVNQQIILNAPVE